MSTIEPEAIREGLAAILKTVVPTLEWQRAAAWTYTPDTKVAGTLRNFDIRLSAETEVVNNEQTGQQGAYGLGVEYRTEARLVVSYPVSEYKIDRFIGADGRDLSAVLVSLHAQAGMGGVYPQQWSQDRRVLSTFTGSDGGYVGTHAFVLHFRVPFTVTLS